jgi:hypothetical protein
MGVFMIAPLVVFLKSSSRWDHGFMVRPRPRTCIDRRQAPVPRERR